MNASDASPTCNPPPHYLPCINSMSIPGCGALAEWSEGGGGFREGGARPHAAAHLPPPYLPAPRTPREAQRRSPRLCTAPLPQGPLRGSIPGDHRDLYRNRELVLENVILDVLRFEPLIVKRGGQNLPISAPSPPKSKPWG